MNYLVIYSFALILSFSFSLSAQTTKKYETDKAVVAWELLLQRGDVIWGFDFLPSGEILFTERSGKLFKYNPTSGKVDALQGVPTVYSQGQGGLLDVKVHPDFAKNKLILFSYSEPIGKEATTSVIRAQLTDKGLKKVKRIFRAKAQGNEDIHFGGRIEFENSKHFFLSVGDRNERNKAQSLKDHNGKILRLDMEGKAPADNPFVKDKEALSEIWSLGHRNPQGLMRDPRNGELWGVEFGPRGGDELNRIEKGKNYGWPLFTQGKEYWGPSIGEAVSKPGFEEPVVNWTPSISPSGAALYIGDKLPMWTGDMFLANLAATHLRRLRFKEGKVIEQEVLLKDMASRFRNVRQSPDGFLYISTDDGKIGRLTK